ncbi:murein hydrolase activator EnvC family protein [Legionella impletisoli]|uniref:Peptidase M24 n=1 Tax=Legionella impletisoli TaxID=343510 RepID=A0A917JY26_9GAMM|nr:peptidoglycan DD-metalloendopeptidase family protein [Legionella impletisoli]GGI89775.1 peptidase M24 [Legionella impletisoli]
MKHPIKWLLLGIFFIVRLSYAEPASVLKTKSQLKVLEQKISRLEKALTESKDKKSILIQELATTEKAISACIQDLSKTHIAIEKNQDKINQLSQEITTLQQELKIEQIRLAKQVRTRYKVGEYQPLKWILNQENPDSISQLLTYYQYLIKAHQQSITTVKTLQAQLATRQNALSQERQEQQGLEKNLLARQEKLEGEKLYQTKLIKDLNQDINHQQQALIDVQKNKENLSRLLRDLAKKSVLSAQTAFAKHKLPFPVAVTRNHINRINQGVMFYAKEGLSVDAVYPGKVVFSDWLKGYGLLIIIDHGRGYMTLYAHNQALFKQKGESVEQGEQIATVGHSGGLKENGLYFEVRHRGKAISPLDWLS